MKDGAHTHGTGGSGLGEIVVAGIAIVIVGPALLALVAALVHALLGILAAGIALAAIGGTALVVWRVRRHPAVLPWTTTDLSAGRASAQVTGTARPALSEPAAAPQLHLHLSGAEAAEVLAAHLAGQNPQPFPPARAPASPGHGQPGTLPAHRSSQ